MQTEQLLYWSGMTDAELSISSSSNEEELHLYVSLSLFLFDTLSMVHQNNTIKDLIKNSSVICYQILYCIILMYHA